MDKPVRANDDTRLPATTTIIVGGLALFGAITLVGWIFSAVVGIVKLIIAVVVVVAILSWIAGRRLDR